MDTEIICSCDKMFWAGVMTAFLPSMVFLVIMLWDAPTIDKD